MTIEMTLADFVHDQIQILIDFEADYRESNKDNPDDFPMRLFESEWYDLLMDFYQTAINYDKIPEETEVE